MENRTDENPGAKSTLLWVLPYMTGTLAFLGLLSFVVGRYLLPEIPLWGHLLAIGLAAVMLAATLIMIKRSGLA